MKRRAAATPATKPERGSWRWQVIIDGKVRSTSGNKAQAAFIRDARYDGQGEVRRKRFA